MKYVLIKYKAMKLLVNEALHMQLLIDHLSEIESLNDTVTTFYKNLLIVTKADGEHIENRRQKLIAAIGYHIIGVPFTNHDAELYALDKKLAYNELLLHGNTGKKNADKGADTHLHIRLPTDKKNRYVKAAQKEGVKLSEWVIKTLDDSMR